MKQSRQVIALLSIFSLSIATALPMNALTRKKNITKKIEMVEPVETTVDSSRFVARDLDRLLLDLDTIPVKKLDFNKLAGPWIFTGFRHYTTEKKFEPEKKLIYPGVEPDSLAAVIEDAEGIAEVSPDGNLMFWEETFDIEEEPSVVTDLTRLQPGYTPKWLRDAVIQMRQQEDLMYATMIVRPSAIDYAYWDLPVPPTLPDDEVTFEAYLRKLDLPEIEADKAILPEEELNKIHWLHNVNAYAHFSQSFISANWYQGGNSHFSLLLGANWNVQLNQVYHPNLLFQSNLSYKLGLYSSPDDKVHDFSFSEDVLQWNLNTGLKATKKWYYSLNALFKTQVFNNYPTNSNTLKASFLSPGDLNVGLGMSYSDKKPNIEFTATISPLSYNLKTCITNKIDHAQFNIDADKKTVSDFGSNAEFNMNWKVRYNINYKTRIFLFTDYSYFLADWEHTFNFDINKFLSTQIFVHMRFDSSSELDKDWRHFMLREVLSFGLSYTFSTK